MKKLVVSLILLAIIATGCGMMETTPSDKVKDFLGKYQSMDSEVLSQLDKVVSDDDSMNDDQKNEYRDLMKKQYQNLSYKIKSEDITDDTAVVVVEIEVLDYSTSISKSRKYYDSHKDEFADNESLVEDANDLINETARYIDYKISELKNVVDTVKYEITFNLDKVDNDWKIQEISDIDRQKIHGLYEN